MKCIDCGKKFNPNHPQASSLRGPKCNQKYVSTFHIPEYVEDVAKKINSHEVYLVGGCVRDFLLGKKPKDFDLVTSATKEDLEQIFPESDPVGKSFGVFKIPTKEDVVEVASFRKDENYSDGRRPDSIVAGTIEDDVARRDFTINGMFFDLKKQTIIDKVGGSLDLKERVVRAIGNPDERFKEDYLRMIRAIRFMVVLDFKLEEKTLNSLRRNFHHADSIPKERIKVEVDRVLSNENFHKNVDELNEIGFFKLISNSEIDSNFLKEKKPSILYSYANIFKNEKEMRNFKLSYDEIKEIKKIQEIESKLCDFDKLGVAEKNKLGYFLTADGFNFSKTPHTKEIKKVIFELKQDPLNIDLFTSGKELVDLGLKPGIQVGKIISELESLVFERKIVSLVQKKAFLKEKVSLS